MISRRMLAIESLGSARARAHVLRLLWWSAALLVVASFSVSQRAAAQPRERALHVLSSGMCLVARAGWGERPVVQVPCQNYSDQDWMFEYFGSSGPGVEGQVRIRNVDRDLCLVTRGSSDSRAVVTTCGTAPDQLWWVIRDANTGYYALMNSNSSYSAPMCLVVKSGSAEAQAQQTRCDKSHANQLWIWEGWF